MSNPFRTWNDRAAHEFAPGVGIHAIGGEQVLMCRVSYAPGATIPLHDHPEAEQLVYLVEGDLTMVIDGERGELTQGDVAVVSRGTGHELWTESGCTFIEALSPVRCDHVPDPERDLVLGRQGDALHVDR